MQVLFQIVRQNLNAAPWIQDYTLDVEPSTTILDCLNQIKWEQDGSLAFRKNCRNTICGSCAIRINGRSALACKENVGQELERLRRIADTEASGPETSGLASKPLAITIAPMGNMPVLKDLVVDMQSFWGNLKAVNPYVSTAARQISEREFLQSPEDRAKLDQMGNCILCGACYSDCNAREVNPEFVGPHALAKAQRMLLDTRDQTKSQRLEQYNHPESGVWGCTRCYNCNTVCPMEVAPLDQITQIKSAILAQPEPETGAFLRHRQAMVELVKQGGWIDERKFGLQVVSNNLRDPKGLLSLIPLGLRMLQRRKFPLEFHPSAGTPEVRALMEAVQFLESSGAPTTANPTMTTPTVKSSPLSAVETPATETEAPAFGWTRYAELINGRFAMIGFLALLLLELMTDQDFFSWIGWR